jgi:multidrug efflux pump subunit AcrA (membrane-fusion protein)
MTTLRFLLLTLLLGILPGCGHSAGSAPAEEEEEGVVVHTTPAAERTIAESVSGLGRCEAVPGKIALLTAAIEGRVIVLRAHPGEQVIAGQPIIELDPAAARANLDEKQAARDSLEASLRLLESRPRLEEQEAAKLAIQQAEVLLEKARISLDRLRPLRARGEVSQAVVYEAESALRQAELAEKTAKAQYEVLMLLPRPQALAEARARLAAADATLRAAQTQLDLHTLASPIPGVLDSLTCSLGQTLTSGTAVGQVIDARQLDVVVWLAAPDAWPVRVGQPAEVRPAGAKAASGRAELPPAIQGRVVCLGAVTDAASGNLPVRIRIDNAEGKLVSGQTLSAGITTNRRKALAVPREAIQDTGAGSALYVVRDEKAILLHPTLGLADRHWVEVTGTDLKPDEPVIVEGGYDLEDGAKVQVAP